jgi:GNAT superfamily N-acetyltransferase
VKYLTQPLTKQHDRKEFDCGETSLNDFLRQFARQNNEKGLGRTFVAVLPQSSRVYGYYTLASGMVRYETAPKKLPRYPVPVALLGRLAVDKVAKGQGLGEFLLLDALRRAAGLAEQIGIYAVEVDALNEQARAFYLKYGFLELLDDRQRLFLPIETIQKLELERQGQP